MISQIKLDKLTEDELHILGYIFKDLLLDKNLIGETKLPLHRLKWLQKEPSLKKIKESQELLVDEYKSLINSIISKLI
jgi:hypothetical protein